MTAKPTSPEPGTTSPKPAPAETTYPAGMEDQRGQPQGTGRAKPGPKNPPEAATVQDNGDED